MGAVGMRGLELHTYPWDAERMEPDLDASARLIRDLKPKLCLFGQSMFLFPTPLKELAQAAHEVGAVVMYDGAHVLGLIAGGQFQDPLREGADVLTGSSHKTFPGPQGGFVLSDSRDEKFQRKLHAGVFPGVVSSYHLHHVAGKVVALAEFQQFGAAYARDTVANAQALGAALAERGFEVLGAGRAFTRSHQVVTRHGAADSGAGATAAQTLESCGIITNMNMLPGDSKPLTPSGVRLGVQELTRVGMGKGEMAEVAEFFRRALVRGEEPARIRRDIKAFKARFQEVRYCFNEARQGGYEFFDLTGPQPRLATMA
jgi:glycine hydroxymethyltransferase